MSEYESHGRGHAASYDASPTVRSAESRARTPAEQARDAVASLVQRTQDAELAIEAARSARMSNQIEQWNEARSRIDRAIAQAEKALERACGTAHDATSETKLELEAVAARLASHKGAAESERGEAAPTGFATISCEEDILAIIKAPVEGGAEAGFARKRQQLEAQFDSLSPIERRLLAERLTRKRENDPIAIAFATRLNDRRRNGLLKYLTNAASRAVQPGQQHPRARSTVEHDSSLTTPLRSNSEQPQIVVAQPESLDAKLRRILEASHSHATIENLFALSTMDLDGTTRRALAKRLETYRPGGGDEIAARFMRLDRALKQRICNGLRSEQSAARAPQPLPETIRGELEAATGTALAHVNVHADAHGNSMAEAHGARAVAIGSDIYMGEGQLDVASGDGRELIAHEVAHVVQAQADAGPTCSAPKRDGEAIGAAEEDADDFAVRFRQHGAAMSWRPSVGVAGGTPLRAPSAGQSVSGRKTDQPKKVDASKPDVAWAYLRANHDKFIAAIEKRLGTVTPPAHERLAWVHGGIATRFAAALDAALAGDPLFLNLPALVHPADPWYLIDQNRTLVEGTPGVIVDGREPRGALTWNPLVGDAVAFEVVTRLRESIARMIPRYLLQLDTKQPDPVTVTDLVTSHPMDRVTASLIVDEAVMRPVAAKRAAKAKLSKDPTLFPNGVRFLEDWKWLGETDRNLWNWIEVKNPRDATAEDVAATLLHRDGAPPSHQAYGITAAPPYFRMEPSWARMFADAKAYAPDGVDKPHADNGLALAESAFATEAAIAQAADERKFDRRGIPLPPNLERLTEVLDASQRQLERVKQLLIPWKLWELVLPAAAWVAKHREHLLAIPSGRLVGLTPVIEGQQTILFEAVGEIQKVVEAGGRSAGSEGDTGPITNVLRQFAITIGESHLIDTARAQLARAQQAKAGMTLALLDHSLRESHNAVRELKSNESRMKWGGAVSASDQHAADHRQLIELHAKHAAGETVDEDDVDLLAANLKEHAFDTRTKSLYLQLYNLREEVRDAGQGVIATLALALEGADITQLSNVGELKKQMRFLDVSPKLTTLMDDLRTSVIDTLPATKQDRIRANGGATSKHVQAWASNEAVRYAEQQLTEFVARNKLGEVIKQAIEKIEDQRIRTLIVQIGILIGVGVVGGVAGSIVGGAIRGGMLADAAVASVGMMRNAQTVGTIANIATDATVNAIGQVLVMGGSGKDAFVDNLLSNAAVRVALAPLHRAAAAWGAVEIDLQNLSKWERLGHRTKTTLAAGGLLTAEMITGAAVSYVVQRARKSGGPVDDKTAASWALEGASMVVGRFISGRLTGIEQRLAQMAEHGVHLRTKAAKLRTLAKKVDEMGDKDAAMQLLVDHHNLLTEEAKLLETLHTVSKGRISRETIETLSAGNRFEREGVKGIASAALPLRLAGLTPDDASAKTWIGATEDISIALHQASLAGLSIRVLEHDAAARQWRVSFDNEVITIVETPLRGRPRPPKTDPSEADRKHAHRYADAADFMQAQWEGMVKADIDARPVVEVDHLQVGYSIAGVMNQATMPEGPNKLVVYQDKGTLVGRGKQELGQSPKKWDAPGIRGSEQAPKDSQWITSEEHARSLDIGRLEAQTPAYRGSAVALEVRPKGPLGEDWKAPHRAIRVKVRDAGGTERWFYTNRFDNAGGMGPGDLSQVRRVVDSKHLTGMLASGQLLRGEDPDYAHKARKGFVFVWGSTPTGAWVAESAAVAGARVTMAGDTRPPRTDWSTLTAEYSDLMAEVTKLPPGKIPADAKRRLQELESFIASAHSGMALARNRKKGAAYENGLDGREGVSIEFGTPSRIEPGPDGTVLVTIGHGLDAKTMTYDQVVIAHGQDPSAPGAPGGLLGRGAALKGVDANTGARTYEEVPAGTIALEPIWSPPKDGSNERDLLGLQSIDPPGIRLLGAAYASKKLSPWVRQSERAAFEAAVDRMAAPAAPTRDHGPISEHSTGVNTGIERQRDHVPRANEATEAPRFRLPGPERTLELDADRSKWDDQVREWFAIHLRADHQWVRAQRLGGGRSGAVVYRVKVGENEVGIFKIFDTKDGAKHEQEMLKLLASAKLKKMKAVGERGRMSVDPKANMGDALLMDVAKGTSIKELVEHMPNDPTQREKALKQLEFAMVRAAQGLAELHAKFGSKTPNGAPTLMTKEAKLSDANYFLDRDFRGGRDAAKVKAALGDDFERVKAALEGPVLRGFLDANVPATAYHGDANAGNFIVHEYDPRTGYKDLGVIDVGAMKWSVDGQKGTKTGAADVARLLESLETVQPGALTSGEANKLRGDFMKAYLANFRMDAGYGLDTKNYALAEKWYRLELEVGVLKSDPSAKDRILKILEMEKLR